MFKISSSLRRTSNTSLYTLRLTNMEVESPLFVEESSLPSGHFPLPMLVSQSVYIAVGATPC